MTKFIFHGGGASQQTALNDSFYKELVKDVPQNGTVLLVYFASRSNDNSERIKYDIDKCNEFSEFSLNFTVATLEGFTDQIAVADVIYLRGGSTEKLLNVLKQYQNLKEKFVGKTVAGSSAGAYVLSSYYSSHYEDIVQKGLGIVHVRVVTHLDSKTMPPRPDAVEVLKRTATELELILLKEGEWQIVLL